MAITMSADDADHVLEGQAIRQSTLRTCRNFRPLRAKTLDPIRAIGQGASGLPSAASRPPVCRGCRIVPRTAGSAWICAMHFRPHEARRNAFGVMSESRSGRPIESRSTSSARRDGPRQGEAIRQDLRRGHDRRDIPRLQERQQFRARVGGVDAAPASTSGCLAVLRRARSCATACTSADAPGRACGRTIVDSQSAVKTSSGTAMTTGPGTPVVATCSARSSVSAIRAGSVTSAVHFAILPNMWP